jgi:hypothetical protein
MGAKIEELEKNVKLTSHSWFPHPPPTPRTDANESITCKEGDPCIAPDFARQLERELNAAKAKSEVCQCPLAIRLVGDGCERCNPEKAQEIKEQNYEDRISDLERENAELLEALELLPTHDLVEGCVTHHFACDCREALMAEAMQTQRRVIDWRDQSDEGLRLRCGELTSQEIRTIRAVLTAILPPNVKADSDFCRKLEIRLNVQREALEAADECLALIEDVGHGAMMDNVTVARGIVLAALSQNAERSQKQGALDSATPPTSTRCTRLRRR